MSGSRSNLAIAAGGVLLLAAATLSLLAPGSSDRLAPVATPNPPPTLAVVWRADPSPTPAAGPAPSPTPAIPPMDTERVHPRAVPPAALKAVANRALVSLAALAAGDEPPYELEPALARQMRGLLGPPGRRVTLLAPNPTAWQRLPGVDPDVATLVGRLDGEVVVGGTMRPLDPLDDHLQATLRRGSGGVWRLVGVTDHGTLSTDAP